MRSRKIKYGEALFAAAIARVWATTLACLPINLTQKFGNNIQDCFTVFGDSTNIRYILVRPLNSVYDTFAIKLSNSVHDLQLHQPTRLHLPTQKELSSSTQVLPEQMLVLCYQTSRKKQKLPRKQSKKPKTKKSRMSYNQENGKPESKNIK